MATEKTRGTEGTAALEKALDVLDAIGAAPGGLSQAALAERLALPRTTLYRLLGALAARGLLRRDPQRRVYALGPRCMEYARSAYAMPDLVAAASAELRALRDMTGETTYLATLDGLESVALERCDGAHSQRSASAVGQRKPLHCTSQGKAMLAAMAAERRAAIVRSLNLEAVTPRSITDRRRLAAELDLTATRGWSIDDEEIVPGVRCCGAPIIDGAGQVRGAISVAGPAFRLTMERLELIGPEVAEAARRIGAQLPAPPAAAGDGQARAVAVAGGTPLEWAFEGAAPRWCAGEGALYWADALAPAVRRCANGRDALVADLAAPVEALLPHAQGAAVLAGGAWHLVHASGRVAPLAALPSLASSAVCTAPDGTPWACVADGTRWGIAALAPAGHAGWHLSEPATALAWDAAGRTLAIAAARSGSLFVATPGSRTLRRLATVPKGSGRLAGLAFDSAGGLWSALRGGWSVARFEADGSLDRVIALPVPCPTDLGFGGADGRTLYVTSARDAVSREALDAAPLSGRLFAIEVAVAGVAMAPLASMG